MNVGVRRRMLSVPRFIGRRRVAAVAQQARGVMAELSDEHRRLHRHVVAELLRSGGPLTPAMLAEQLDLTTAEISRLLDGLAAKKALIARTEHGAVLWAYPVTAAETPHRLRFRSGERLYAA